MKGEVEVEAFSTPSAQPRPRHKVSEHMCLKLFLPRAQLISLLHLNIVGDEVDYERHLDMSCSPSRSFRVKADADGNTIDINISELAGISAENLGLATWGASVVLAGVLYRWKAEPWTSEALDRNTEDPLNEGVSILELGAGTGLAGLAAAALWHLPTAVLTDLPSIIPGIDLNVRLNKSLFGATAVFAGSLDWTKPEYLHVNNRDESISASNSSKASIILAADTCYSADHPDLISSTVVTWLAREKESRAIFCYPLRMAYINHARNLWRMMDQRGFVCLEEGKESSDELWGEFEPAPYEWSVWGWKDFHPDAVKANEADSAKSDWISW